MQRNVRIADRIRSARFKGRLDICGCKASAAATAWCTLPTGTRSEPLFALRRDVPPNISDQQGQVWGQVDLESTCRRAGASVNAQASSANRAKLPLLKRERPSVAALQCAPLLIYRLHNPLQARAGLTVDQEPAPFPSPLLAPSRHQQG